MLTNILFIFICFSFFLNQIGRIDLGNNVAFTLLDASISLFCIYFLFCLILKKIRLQKDKFVKPFLFFIIVAVLSLLFNSFQFSSMQIFIGFLYLVRFCIYCFFYVCARTLLRHKQQLVAASLKAIGIILLLVGYIQYFFYPNLRNLYYLGWDEHIYRLFSSFLDPNFAGAFFVLFFFFILGCWQHTKRNERLKHLLYFILSSVTLLTILLTYSRSAFLMLLVCSLTYFSLQRKIKYAFGTIIVVVLFLLLVSSHKNLESTNLLRSTSSDARIASSIVAWNIWQKNPLFGVGFNTYRYAQIKYGYRAPATKFENHADAGADNSFLFVLATTGLVGFITFIYLQWRLVKQLLSERKKYIFPTVLLASLIGLFVDSLFINALFYPSFIFWIALLLGIRDYR